MAETHWSSVRTVIGCAGLLTASAVLAACSVLGSDAPPDYAQPYDLIDPFAMRQLLGLEGLGPGELSGSGAGSTANIVVADGRWARAEMLYVDQPLSEVVNPPSGADLRGQIVEVPVKGEARTVTFVERPPTVVDELLGCVRLVVSTRDFAPIDPERRQQFVENVEIGLSEWLAGLSDDPCEGRPESPPPDAAASPMGPPASG